MLLYVFITALVLAALALLYPLIRTPRRLDEVDRFHTARALTTTWATEPSAPVQVPDEEPV